MIKEILITLSDTELIALSKELDDPTIDNVSIYNQLFAKSNYPVDMSDFEYLPTKLAVVIGERLLESDRC